MRLGAFGQEVEDVAVVALGFRGRGRGRIELGVDAASFSQPQQTGAPEPGLSDRCAMLTGMNEDAFWQLIEDCRPTEPDPDAELLAATLTERLVQSPLSLVIGFAEQLSWALYRLDRKEYGHDLGGDAFLYTRAAVVAAGRTEFDSVLQHPSAFTSYAIAPIWAEPLLYTPDQAYKRITEEEWDRDTRYSYESFSNTEGWAD